MRRAFVLGWVVASFAFVVAPLTAQELVEEFCAMLPNATCSDDNLSVRFDGPGGNGNIYEYDQFAADMRITATMVMSTVTAGIQGWSYGVVHTAGDVTLAEADLVFNGTDARATIDGTAGALPFFSIKLAAGTDAGGNPLVGFIQAVVLDFNGNAALPVQENTLLFATYGLARDVGTEGTILRFASLEVGVPGSPVTEINITSGGGSLAPNTLTHGQIRQAGAGCVPTETPAELTCNDGLDNDCDGLIDDADPDCAVVSPGCPEGTPANALYFDSVGADVNVAGDVAIVSRNDTDLLGFSFGVSIAAQANSQTWSFSGDLGNNDRDGNPVLIDLNFTSADGGVTPAAGNMATVASADPITSVSRGADIAGFADDPDDQDFFAIDLNPGLGGPGFFVGYVNSLGGDITKVIPVTPSPMDACPSRELIRVSVGGGTPFNRGDANGDGRISVTDGILVIQNAAGNIAARFPNCPAIRDANGDGTNDLADGVFLLNYVFRKASPVPPAPFRTCEIGPGECAESNCAN